MRDARRDTLARSKRGDGVALKPKEVGTVGRPDAASLANLVDLSTLGRQSMDFHQDSSLLFKRNVKQRVSAR